MGDHLADGPNKTFWLAAMLGVFACSFLSGAAVAPRAVDDDAAVGVGLALSGVLALGQLINPDRMSRIFVRAGAIVGLFLLGLGWGMRTGFLVMGQHPRVPSYLVVIAVAAGYGVVGGAVVAVMGVVASKVARGSLALGRPLVTDDRYRRGARWLSVLAPAAVAFYLVLRYVAQAGLRSSSQGFWFVSAHPDTVVMYLGVLDVLFAVGTVATLLCLLLSALAARRRIQTG